MNICDRLKGSGPCAVFGAVGGAVTAAVGGAAFGFSAEEIETIVAVSAAANAVLGAACGFCIKEVLSDKNKKATYAVIHLANEEVAPWFVATATNIGVSPTKVFAANAAGIALGACAGVVALGGNYLVSKAMGWSQVECAGGSAV